VGSPPLRHHLLKHLKTLKLLSRRTSKPLIGTQERYTWFFECLVLHVIPPQESIGSGSAFRTRSDPLSVSWKKRSLLKPAIPEQPVFIPKVDLQPHLIEKVSVRFGVQPAKPPAASTG
jgi:hypothetical protein